MIAVRLPIAQGRNTAYEKGGDCSPPFSFALLNAHIASGAVGLVVVLGDEIDANAQCDDQRDDQQA